MQKNLVKFSLFLLICSTYQAKIICDEFQLGFYLKFLRKIVQILLFTAKYMTLSDAEYKAIKNTYTTHVWYGEQNVSLLG